MGVLVEGAIRGAVDRQLQAGSQASWACGPGAERGRGCGPVLPRTIVRSSKKDGSIIINPQPTPGNSLRFVSLQPPAPSSSQPAAPSIAIPRNA